MASRFALLFAPLVVVPSSFVICCCFVYLGLERVGLLSSMLPQYRLFLWMLDLLGTLGVVGTLLLPPRPLNVVSALW